MFNILSKNIVRNTKLFSPPSQSKAPKLSKIIREEKNVKNLHKLCDQTLRRNAKIYKYCILFSRQLVTIYDPSVLEAFHRQIIATRHEECVGIFPSTIAISTKENLSWVRDTLVQEISHGCLSAEVVYETLNQFSGTKRELLFTQGRLPIFGLASASDRAKWVLCFSYVVKQKSALWELCFSRIRQKLSIFPANMHVPFPWEVTRDLILWFRISLNFSILNLFIIVTVSLWENKLHVWLF